jgi:hypothetical protein
MLKAKTIIDNRFWVIENDSGERIGTIAQNKDKVSYRVGDATEDFPSFADMLKKKNVIIARKTRDVKKTESSTEVYSYPTNHTPHNHIWNVQMKLPLYTKTAKSSSYHCAGYYIIKFDRTWCKSFTPKLITLQRYPYQGPFTNKTDLTSALRKALETA